MKHDKLGATHTMRISYGLRTTAQVLLTGCLFAALTPGTATGQGGYLIFQAGYFVPTGELGVLQEAGFVEAIEFGKRNRSFAYSLGLELPIASPFSGRATLAYGTSTDLPVQEVRCPDCEARSSVLMATAALVFRPLPSGLAIQPYLLAGGGVKHYDLVSLDELQRAPVERPDPEDGAGRRRHRVAVRPAAPCNRSVRLCQPDFLQPRYGDVAKRLVLDGGAHAGEWLTDPGALRKRHVNIYLQSVPSR